ncbi:citrate lyase acyl carrier protein [Brachyspira hyodysenteriae]|uniref:citrate lyase acyl carrier protein n=1 Tax=Brachyspira hyodysenteriae TaxID=159 RepID=UPI0022CD2EE5|nr:citrate lyase acyl carrier protein [Brachyspira hyodysenteriae]MDA0035351.1 citrate lyase acyl carrier protein [Brachyspira hyodysenteriae]MDA0049439.1 citrate lyase acyl carrier protein [Brachyspira hyodysenteriae]MDA1468900.1 citrate lyase acyl carrier protein [Brachyspira hyodysenteriae]
MATKKISDDAIINATITNSGGIVININSTVKHMFFNNIKKAVEEVVNETDIKNIVIDVDDYGALDFCIRARTRMAIRRAVKSLEAVK